MMTAIIGIYHNRTETTPDRRERLNDHSDPDTGGLCGAFWGTCKLCYVSQVATYNREAVTFEDGKLAAHRVVAFDDRHVVSGHAQTNRSGQTPDASADDDDVRLAHNRSPSYPGERLGRARSARTRTRWAASI